MSEFIFLDQQNEDGEIVERWEWEGSRANVYVTRRGESGDVFKIDALFPTNEGELYIHADGVGSKVLAQFVSFPASKEWSTLSMGELAYESELAARLMQDIQRCTFSRG